VLSRPERAYGGLANEGDSMLARRVFILTVVLSLIGCGDDTDPGDAGGGLDGGVDAGGMDAGVDAGPPTPDSGSDAGVDAGEIIDSGRDGGPLFACSLEELTPIFECARMACVMLPDAGLSLPDGGLEGGLPEAGLPDASLPDPGELATCILRSCGLLVFGVSGGCRGCLLAGVGMDLDTIAAACAPGVPIP